MRTMKNRKGSGPEFGVEGIIVLIVGIIFFVGIMTVGGAKTELLYAFLGGGNVVGEQIAVNLHDSIIKRGKDLPQPSMQQQRYKAVEKDTILLIANAMKGAHSVWEYTEEDVSFDVMAAGDFNGDRVDELVVGTESDVIKVVYPEEYMIVDRVGYDIHPAMTAGDFDADGKDELVIVKHEHPIIGDAKDTIYIYDSISKYGFSENRLKAYSKAHIHALASGDFDADGKDDLAVGFENGKIKILTEIELSKERVKEARTINAYSNFYPNTMAAGNFTGKNHDSLAYLTNEDDVVWIIANPLKDNAKKVYDFDCDMNAFGAGDINADGLAEIVAICNGDDKLWVISEPLGKEVSVRMAKDFSKNAYPLVVGKFS